MTANRPEVCVGAVVVDDDRLLLVRRGRPPHAGYWSIPGGRVEHGETLAEALVREVREETGIDVVSDRFLGWVERFDNDLHAVILDFEAISLDDDPPLRAGDDASECAWAPLVDVPEMLLVPGLAEFLSDHGFIELLA